MINIIPIGPNCSPAIALRKMAIRRFSYPWDWADKTSVYDIIEIIKNKKIFKVADWNILGDSTYLPHDRTGDSHGESENSFYQTDIIGKYERRFKRFFEHIEIEGTYLLRFGNDRSGLDEIKKLLPKCKIIHIPDGHQDSQDTINKISSLITEDDPISRIINVISYITDIKDNVGYISFPVSKKDIIQHIRRTHDHMIINQSIISGDVEKGIELLFKNSPRIHKNKNELLAFLKERALILTNIDYTLY